MRTTRAQRVLPGHGVSDAYFDEIPTAHDSQVTPTDVVCASALHPGLSRADLAWFQDHADDLSELLDAMPADVTLAGAPDRVVDVLAALPSAARVSGEGCCRRSCTANAHS